MISVNDDLFVAYQATLDTLPILLRDCSQETASIRYGGEENWSIVEVLGHLRDAEERSLERFRLIRDQDNPHLEAYDQDAWARERDYAAGTLSEVLAEFLDFRKTFLAELAVLTPEGWGRTGQHEEHGPITLFDLMIHLVSHDSIHMAQIARQLEGRA